MASTGTTLDAALWAGLTDAVVRAWLLTSPKVD